MKVWEALSNAQSRGKAWEATYKSPSGGLVRVRVSADNSNHAKQMLESQYGKGKIINLHQIS